MTASASLLMWVAGNDVAHLLNTDILCDIFWIRFLNCLPKLSFDLTYTPRHLKSVTLYRFAILIHSQNSILGFGLEAIKVCFQGIALTSLWYSV